MDPSSSTGSLTIKVIHNLKFVPLRLSLQDVPQEAYGGRGQSAAMTPGKPNQEELSVSQQERPSSLPVSLTASTRDATQISHLTSPIPDVVCAKGQRSCW